VTAPAGRLWLAGAAVVGVVSILVDQATKTWALTALEGRQPIHLLGSLRLALSYNSGVAFSLGRGSGLTIVPVALAVVVVVIFVARHLPGRLPALSVGLVVGGATSNLADRLFRNLDGSVVDFIDLQWWPVFNVADSCIVVGGILLAVCSMRRPVPAVQSDGPTGDGT